METYPLNAVILYVRDIPRVAQFYQQHFGYEALPSTEPGWLQLKSPAGGCMINLHQAAKSQKRGSEIKLELRRQGRRRISKPRHAPRCEVRGDSPTAWVCVFERPRSGG